MTLKYDTFAKRLHIEMERYYLEEGLVASYDIEKLVNKLQVLLKDNIKEIGITPLKEEWIKTKYGKVCTAFIELKTPLSQKDKEQIDNILDLYGYINSKSLVSNDSLQIEPKVPVKLNDYIEQRTDKKLFHITQKKHLDKIKKIGLTPRASQTTFDHPNDRIYLLWLPLTSSKYIVCIKFANVLAKDKNLNIKDLAIIEMDYNPSKNYYIDDATIVPQQEIVGLFTTSNIDPKEFVKIVNI